jgi:hypothetical protein
VIEELVPATVSTVVTGADLDMDRLSFSAKDTAA